MERAPDAVVKDESAFVLIVAVEITEFTHNDRLVVAAESVKCLVEETYHIGAIIMNLYNVHIILAPDILETRCV